MDLDLIRTDARYLVSPQLTSTQYTDTALDRNANRWYRKVVGWVVTTQGDWEIGGDILYRDVQEGVTDYELPVGLLRVYKGEIMYETGGSFVPLDFISVQASQGTAEGNATRFIDDVTAPTAELIGDTVVIRPAGTEDVTNGIKLWAQLDLEDLVDASDSPQLMEPVQRAISIGAAMDYCEAEEMWTKFRELKYQMFGDPRVKNDDGVKGELEKLYSLRSGARRLSLNPRRRNYR